MNKIYLLVSYYLSDRTFRKNVETHMGFYTNETDAKNEANELNNKRILIGDCERFLVRGVNPAPTE